METLGIIFLIVIALLVLAALAAMIVSASDVRRYLRIRRM